MAPARNRQFERDTLPECQPSSERGQGSTRVQRFLDRVDRHLAALPDARLRRRFLHAQTEAWESRYSRFLATSGASEPIRDSSDPPHAADFVLTIGALVQRRHALSGGNSMPRNNRQTDLHRAMLALLVAADQRCPSIIGQAHLLYHAEAESLLVEPAHAVAQLKSDAQDLLEAIAAAEAALRLSVQAT